MIATPSKLLDKIKMGVSNVAWPESSFLSFGTASSGSCKRLGGSIVC